MTVVEREEVTVTLVGRGEGIEDEVLVKKETALDQVLHLLVPLVATPAMICWTMWTTENMVRISKS